MRKILTLQLLYGSASLMTGLSSCRKNTSCLLVGEATRRFPLCVRRASYRLRRYRSNVPLDITDSTLSFLDYSFLFDVSVTPTHLSLSTLPCLYHFLYPFIIVINKYAPHTKFSSKWASEVFDTPTSPWSGLTNPCCIQLRPAGIQQTNSTLWKIMPQKFASVN